MKIKKLICWMSALFLAAGFLSFLPAQAVTFTPPDEIHSESALLINLDSDLVIYEKNPDKKMYPASLTKIMTAIVVLEHIEDLQGTMIEADGSIFDELYQSGASTADFRPWEIATASDLMYGMMLQSACEAASILAFHVGNGSVSAFVGMMNDKAAELGCENTHFSNAHGLFASDQYTTAADMAKITEYAINMPRFMEICNNPNYTLATTNKHSETRVVKHTNMMLDKNSRYYYAPTKGIKTGTLDESGRCLITEASKDGYNYLAITLGAPLVDAEGNNTRYDFEDHTNLYQWAFSDFAYQTLLKSDEEIGEVPVQFSNSEDYVLVSPAEDYTTLWQTSIDVSSIKQNITLKEDVMAPVKKGDILGSVELQLSGETMTTVDLIATAGRDRSLIKYNLYLAQQFLSSPWFKAAVIAVFILLLIYVSICSRVARKKRKKSRARRPRSRYN